MNKRSAKGRAAAPRTLAEPARRVRRSIGRPKREDHKVGATELVLRTCELLNRMRPHKVTIAAVARHAGVNPALIRYYFRDRSSLMVAAAQHFVIETAQMRKLVAGSPEVAERTVRERLRLLIDLHRSCPSFKELFFEEIMNTPAGKAQRVFREVTERGVAATQSMLDVLASDDRRRAQTRRLEASLFYVALLGLSEFYVSAFKILETGVGAKLDPDTVDQQYVDFLSDIILNGLRRRKR